MRNNQTRFLTILAILITIELILMFTPLGYIPIGVLRATTMHIPVIIAGIVLGKKGGIILGLTFGLSSILYNTLFPTLTSFVFSPFVTIGEFSGGIQSIIIALIPRILLGYFTALVYEKTFKYDYNIRIIVGSLIGTLTNTVLVLSGIYLFFGNSYAIVRGIDYSLLLKLLLGIIATNGLLEIIIAIIVSLAICRTVKGR